MDSDRFSHKQYLIAVESSHTNFGSEQPLTIDVFVKHDVVARNVQWLGGFRASGGKTKLIGEVPEELANTFRAYSIVDCGLSLREYFERMFSE